MIARKHLLSGAVRDACSATISGTMPCSLRKPMTGEKSKIPGRGRNEPAELTMAVPWPSFTELRI
jgi:hypothetical protein